MSEFEYKAGLNHVGSYQVSGIPYLTASLSIPASSSQPLEILFPSVTQKIHIINLDPANGLRVALSVSGALGTNYYYIENKDSSGKNVFYSCDLKIKTNKIYLLSNSAAITSSVYVSAELTGITGYDLASAYSGNIGIG